MWEGELGTAGRRRGQVSFPEGGGKGMEITSRIDGNGNRDGKRNLELQLRLSFNLTDGARGRRKQTRAGMVTSQN